MLAEAIEVIRELWKGEYVTHHGDFFDVEDARIYTLPDTPPPVYVSGFGPKACALAGRIGDGFVTVQPDKELIRVFRENGGEGKPMQGGYKVCYGRDAAVCVDTVHQLWPNEGLPGELAQVLYSPRHFEQASQLVTKEMIASSTPHGPEEQTHIDAFSEFADAGFDEIFISQIGGARPETSYAGFFEYYRDLLPKLRDAAS
jgi:G6PDH family F420-dependent oxidoreductase